jgi:16S rRNA (cytidine1402-2'-O)-methyltransferase
VEALEDILGTLGDRPLVVAREMTKLHEEFVRGSVQDAIRRFREGAAPLGECTLVIGGAMETPAWSDGEIRRALKEKKDEGVSASRAADEVAAISGVSRKNLYRIIHEKGIGPGAK